MLAFISSGMRETNIPILYLYAKSGFINRKPAVEYAKAHFNNATFVFLGKGKHFLTESHPAQMSRVFDEWFAAQIR